uniref:CRIB domain-containing protein n=1 Tax=Eptatretus burgeri TaxID=7764 RepID=A0A8C4N3B9_EPTBU
CRTKFPIYLLPASPGRRRGTKPADLRPDMISGPMDDFRHTVHVGRGGDAFGDTSFLSELPPGNLPGSPATVIRAPSPKPGLLAWTLRPGKRLAPGVSPIIKNAFSLPLLTTTTAISGLNPLERAKIGRGSGIGRNVIDFSTAQMKHAESVLSFNLDLGPSMLNDVLRVMDTAELQPSMYLQYLDYLESPTWRRRYTIHIYMESLHPLPCLPRPPAKINTHLYIN